MSILDERYTRVYKHPWKGKDYIMYKYGGLRPKGFGEMLFSEEWNYIVETLYYLHYIKHLIPPKAKFPQVSKPLFDFSVIVGLIVYVLLRLPSEVRVEFADVLLSLLSIERRVESPDATIGLLSYSTSTEFPDVVETLASKDLYVTWSGGPGTLVGGEYSLELAIEIGVELLGDAPYREGRLKVEPTGDLRLGLLYKPAFMYLYSLASPNTTITTLIKELRARTPDVAIQTLIREVTSRAPDVSLTTIARELYTKAPDANLTTMSVSSEVKGSTVSINTLATTLTYRVE